MEEEEEMSSPFWLRNSGSFGRQSNRLRRSSSSVFFSSGAIVFTLLAIALVFIFFVIPSILSFTSQLFRPHLVKKSWDSLNLVLVVFAIVCGFLSRNTSNDNNISTPKNSPIYSYNQIHHQTVLNAPSDDSSSQQEVEKSNPSTPRQWYDPYADQTAYNNTSFASSMNRGGVRTSSSYPDLRQQESSWNVTRDEGWQFYDDSRVANYRPSSSDHLHHRRRHLSWHDELVQPPPVQEQESVQTKNIQVDTFVVRPEETPTAQSNYPPPSPPRSASPPPRKEKRTYHALEAKEPSRTNDTSDVTKHFPLAPTFRPPPSPPSPPPPPPLLLKDVESKRSSGGKNVKKKGVATTKEFIITALRKNKKKQRQKSSENFETLLASASSAPSFSLLPPPSPPPPPPPLPPPSVFHNLFSSKKSHKPKKTIHSILQPPPPPSAPPPRTTPTTRLWKTRSQVRPTMTTQKPPLPVKVNTFVNVDDENASSGGESPLVGIPRPPLLPPFGLPVMKYSVVHGDYVRIKSDNSSRSGSPDLDDDQDSIPSPTNATETSGRTPLESGESPKAMFCPSPDVNTKADTFIKRFRAGLRLEKMNSVRGRSNLGPDTSESEGPSY